MKTILVSLTVLLAAGNLHAADPIGDAFPAARAALNLIYQAETNSGKNLRPGDGGKALGHLQQHAAHWREGCRFLGVRWDWRRDSLDLEKCEHVAVAYWCLYARKYLLAGNVDELILRFRKPGNPYAADNLAYLQRVKDGAK